eukprot:scaffold6142_cov257-Pinguiococcus_pyrenoidosus.AAC.5
MTSVLSPRTAGEAIFKIWGRWESSCLAKSRFHFAAGSLSCSTTGSSYPLSSSARRMSESLRSIGGRAA